MNAVLGTTFNLDDFLVIFALLSVEFNMVYRRYALYSVLGTSVIDAVGFNTLRSFVFTVDEATRDQDLVACLAGDFGNS